MFAHFVTQKASAYASPWKIKLRKCAFESLIVVVEHMWQRRLLKRDGALLVDGASAAFRECVITNVLL